MLLQRWPPWLLALLALVTLAALAALTGAWTGTRQTLPRAAIPPPARIIRTSSPASHPTAARPLAVRICVTRHGFCPVGTARTGDPCGCPHPLAGQRARPCRAGRRHAVVRQVTRLAGDRRCGRPAGGTGPSARTVIHNHAEGPFPARRGRLCWGSCRGAPDAPCPPHPVFPPRDTRARGRAAAAPRPRGGPAPAHPAPDRGALLPCGAARRSGR